MKTAATWRCCLRLGAPRPKSSTPSGRVRCRWHRHFCPFSPRIRDSPPRKKSTPRRGGGAHQWKERKSPFIGSGLGTTNAAAIGPARPPITAIETVARGAGPAADKTANTEVAAVFPKTASPQDRQPDLGGGLLLGGGEARRIQP